MLVLAKETSEKESLKYDLRYNLVLFALEYFYCEVKLYDKAIEIANEGIEVNTANETELVSKSSLPAFYELLGDSYKGKGSIDEANETYAWMHVVTARENVDDDKIVDALKEYKEAISFNEGFKDELASSLIDTGLIEELLEEGTIAIEECQEIIKHYNQMIEYSNRQMALEEVEKCIRKRESLIKAHDDLYEDLEKDCKVELERMFGDLWNEIDLEAQKYLIEAERSISISERTEKEIISSLEWGYKGYFKALEHEMLNKIFVPIKKLLLKDLVSKDYGILEKFYEVFYNFLVEKSDSITLSQMLFVLEGNYNSLLQKWSFKLEEIIEDIGKEQVLEKNFLDSLSELCRLRNPHEHGDNKFITYRPYSLEACKRARTLTLGNAKEKGLMKKVLRRS